MGGKWNKWKWEMKGRETRERRRRDMVNKLVIKFKGNNGSRIRIREGEQGKTR